ncbi:MAG TPA: hypothetical protein VIY51_08360 [Xanthobacteraceae bacterium]
MNKGFGIAALVLAIIAIFVPFYGLWVSGIACALAVAAALAGDRIFAVATPIIAGVNTYFLSPAISYVLTQDRTGQLIVLLFLAAPFVAIALNAFGAFRIGSTATR